MMDDLYDDLEEIDVAEELDQLRTKNQTLQDEYTQLKDDLDGATEKCYILEKENDHLKNNISILFKTSQGEIKRKDATITKLRTELEDLKFKRQRMQTHHNYQRPNPELNPKIDCILKPPPNIYEVQNPVVIEPKQENEERQNPSISWCNELRPNNNIISSNYNYEDPRLQHITKNNDSDRNIPTYGMMIQTKQEPDIKWHLRPVSPTYLHRKERTADVQPENLHGNRVPMLENDLIRQLLPNLNTIKMEDQDVLELDFKQEFNDDINIPKIREETDRKRKRSPSPKRKISRRHTPDSDHRKRSPGRNTYRLVSKSKSRESNTSLERQSQSPHNRKRFHRDTDRLIDSKRFGSGKKDYHDRNRDSSYSYNRRRDNDFKRRESQGKVNNDDRKKNTYATEDRHRQDAKHTETIEGKKINSRSKDSVDRENKHLSDKTDDLRERRCLSSNKSVNNDYYDRKNSPSAKDVKSGKLFEPLKHILNLYADSEKDTKHQNYDKKANHQAIGSNLKKITLSLGEYNKRHKSVNESGDTTGAEIKENCTSKENFNNTVSVDSANIREVGMTDPFDKYVNKEDGEVFSDQETVLLKELEKKVDYPIKEHCHIATINNPVTTETLPKISSPSKSQPAVDKIVVTRSKPSKLAEINESDITNKSKRKLSNTPKETKTTTHNSKLLSDEGGDSSALSLNIEDSSKDDDSRKVEELMPLPCEKENTVTDIPTETLQEKNISKYNDKKERVPNTTVINSKIDKPNKCLILPSAPASLISEEKLDVQKGRIPKLKNLENEIFKINTRAAKCDKTSNSSKSRKSNTTDTDSKIQLNDSLHIRVKSNLILGVPVMNSCDISEVIMTKNQNNDSICQSAIIEKASNNSQQNEQIASVNKSTKKKSRKTLFNIFTPYSEILMDSLPNEGALSQTVPRNINLSDSCAKYSEINPSDKCYTKVPETLPITGDASETISKNSSELYNKVVFNSLMSDLMKISQNDPKDFNKCDSIVPKVLPIVKDSRETIPIKSNELPNTSVYDSIMKDFNKLTQTNPAHNDISHHSIRNRKGIVPVKSDRSEDCLEKGKEPYNNVSYDSLIKSIQELSQTNTSKNKKLGDTFIKDDMEICQTIPSNVVEYLNKKEKDAPVINSSPPDALNISLTISTDSQYNSKVSNNPRVTDEQVLVNKFPTVASDNTMGRQILEDTSNKIVDLVSEATPIDLTKLSYENLDYSHKNIKIQNVMNPVVKSLKIYPSWTK